MASAALHPPAGTKSKVRAWAKTRLEDNSFTNENSSSFAPAKNGMHWKNTDKSETARRTAGFTGKSTLSVACN